MKLGFGKYKHLEVTEVFAKDPDYLHWAVNADALKTRPFLRDHVLAVLDKTIAAAPANSPGDATELVRLRLENMRLSCEAADAKRLRVEVERLRREVEELEAEKVMLRRAQATGKVNGSGASVWKEHYRKLALIAHPDRGGSTELMALINEINGRMA